MKIKPKQAQYEEVRADGTGIETSVREMLIKRIKMENFFSPEEVRFVETSQSSN